ncbi:Monooxygenase [Pleurostoma richardsiae]|uniref:Monooxygenase n=1 Tax=Pleurostoma richardsiae TaxID=41990 RepID=A0AA38RFW8_9PEZI|nr:Monooxygenase [Pleurostoma richardsiae]
MDAKGDNHRNYSQFACIGTGFSAICLGATLQRWYGITDVRFFERYDKLGGTWYTNQYPGCACDVPSALYSYSFEPNPHWSRVLPSYQELWDYLNRVAHKYSLLPKMTFGVNVERCEWIEEKRRWRLYIRHYKTDSIFTHECQFLFSASGQLVQPRELDVPGADTFKGIMFHSSKWRKDVELEGKRVIVIGNGCTAAQIVPSIVGKTKHLTQMIRSKHWVYPPIDDARTEALRLICKYIPGTMALQRLLVYLGAENELRGFPMTPSAAKFRQRRRVQVEKYMRSTAPKKYHDILIPDFEVGCKRRIFDSGYLECLHAENLNLTNKRAEEIVPEGIRTKSGIIEADVIILANGYVTNKFLTNIDIVGREGTLAEHWDSFGGAEAYNCSVLSGFPNFFILLGPNAATGHTSAIMAAENSINYALRVLKPILEGKASVAGLKRDAEERYVSRIQTDLSKTVWNSGCSSWYIEKDAEKGQTWNAMSYPYSQAHFWYRSLFPTWSDWEFSGPKSLPAIKRSSSLRVILKAFLVRPTPSLWTE